MPIVGGSRIIRGGAGGHAVEPSGRSAPLGNVAITVQSQTNALTDPTDTPTVDTIRAVRDSAGNLVLYVYSLTQAAWKGVQLG